MPGGQPGNSNSILPKINSFLVNTFFQSGSSNTAQIHPLQPGAIANTLGPSPKIAKKQPSKRKNSVGIVDTGRSLSEGLLFAEHGENMLCTYIVLDVKNNFCTQHVLPMIVDEKRKASEKDLPVQRKKMKTN